MPEINVAQKTLCDFHAKAAAGKNEAVITFLMMKIQMDRVVAAAEQGVLDKDGRPTDATMQAAFHGVMGAGTALCCDVGEAKFAEIVAQAPPTTGDPKKDEEIAGTFVEGIERERLFPQPGTYTRSTEGGIDYYLHLSPANGDGKGGFVQILTQGHSAHGDDPMIVLHVARAATVRDARRTFRKWLNEKSWIPKQ